MVLLLPKNDVFKKIAKIKSFLKRWVLYFASKIVAWAAEHRQLEQNKKYRLNKSISLYNVSLIGKVEIGDFTYINEGSTLSGGESSSVKIGKHCAIGRQVHITSKTHDFSLPTSDETHIVHNTIEKDTVVGNYVWIGDKVFIKEGITIGDNAIIGANSVVIEDVKAFEIVAGIPARHIRFNVAHYKYSDNA